MVFRRRIGAVDAAVGRAIEVVTRTGREPSVGLVQVALYFHLGKDVEPTTHIVAMSELGTFLAATLELHFSPGVNPHSRVRCSRVLCITSADMVADGPFWWTVPGLRDNDDPRGAVVFRWTSPVVIWHAPGVPLPESLRSSSD